MAPRCEIPAQLPDILGEDPTVFRRLAEYRMFLVNLGAFDESARRGGASKAARFGAWRALRALSAWRKVRMDER